MAKNAAVSPKSGMPTRADKRKSYCIYEAPSPEALREAARRLDIPADVIMEVSEVNPTMFLPAEEVTERSGVPTAAKTPVG